MSREEILKRRARFVSAALLIATGCTRAKEGAAPLPDSEAVKPMPEPPTAKPAKVKPMDERPSLDAKVSAAGEAKLKSKKDEIAKHYAVVDKLASEVPAPCVLTEKSCKERFQKFADEVAQEKFDLIHLAPRCPAKVPDDKAIEDMFERHRDWLMRWIFAINKAAGESADAGAEWEKIRDDAEAAHPQPCLKFACP
jgi:hypothetical protein